MLLLLLVLNAHHPDSREKKEISLETKEWHRQTKSHRFFTSFCREKRAHGSAQTNTFSDSFISACALSFGDLLQTLQPLPWIRVSSRLLVFYSKCLQINASIFDVGRWNPKMDLLRWEAFGLALATLTLLMGLVGILLSFLWTLWRQTQISKDGMDTDEDETSTVDSLYYPTLPMYDSISLHNELSSISFPNK